MANKLTYDEAIDNNNSTWKENFELYGLQIRDLMNEINNLKSQIVIPDNIIKELFEAAMKNRVYAQFTVFNTVINLIIFNPNTQYKDDVLLMTIVKNREGLWMLKKGENSENI